MPPREIPADEIPADEVADARRAVRRTLGSAMAAKASPEFCVAVHRGAAPPVAFGAETTVTRDTGAMASVVEFGGDAEMPPPALAGPAGRAGLTRALDGLGATPADRVRLAAALRRAAVGGVREAGYRVVGQVYDEVERLSGGTLGPGPEVVGVPGVPTAVTQVCWLNRTLRTWAGPAVLAEVAGDPAVSRVDVPRRLMPDAGPPGHAAIDLPAFLERRPGTGAGVTVAVIDSEVLLGHPALAGRVVHRRNYTAEPWGNPDRHGTAVAGIIAGDDRDHGGIAPGAVIYNYKVLATNRFLHGDDFAGSIAVQQALEDGADIANCSWGDGPAGPVPSRGARAVETAVAAGLSVVKSAGNRGPGERTMTSPAEARGVVVVGATDVDGNQVEPYSSRGAAGRRAGPDVVAPGGSEAVALICCLTTGGFGDAGVGTSFAAPHVSGLLALYLAGDPGLPPADLRRRLREHARPLTGFAARDQGRGLVTAG